MPLKKISDTKLQQLQSAAAQNRAKLLEKLKDLPAAPGVYFHKNADGEIIYIGKAAVLKNRVRQYFHSTKKDAKTEALVAEIFDTDWRVVDTEMDALFLEEEMVKHYLPKWNVLLRDDKSPTYVRIDSKSEIPYVSFTHTPQDDRADYIGPFYSKTPVEKSLRILRKIFPYYNKPYDGKRTLDTDLGLTPGIEIGKTTLEQYKKNLRKLKAYISGANRHGMMKILEKEMQKAAKAENFEEAAELKRQLQGLQELRKKIVFSNNEFLDLSSDYALTELQTLLHLDLPPRRIEGYDISHQSGTNVVGSMVVFMNGVSSRQEYRKFKLRSQKNDDIKNLREILERRLKHSEWPLPDLMILDGGIGQVNAVQDLLNEYHGTNNVNGTNIASPIAAPIPIIGRDKSGNHSKNAQVKIIVPTDDGCKEILLSENSHAAKLIARIDDEAHRFALTYHTLLKRKRMLS